MIAMPSPEDAVVARRAKIPSASLVVKHAAFIQVRGRR
jgi:hypothetical protein